MAGTVITKKGLQLIAKLVASGTALTFTRASVGTGSIPSGYDPKNMTDLNNYKMEGLISSCSSSADEASIIMQISSMGVETGFTITEIGLFATDPDEGEILYAYLDLSKDPQYVYAEDSAISKFVEMTLVVKVGSVESVTAYLNPESLVTRDGDISETVIETLDTVEDKYPVPAAGESVKRFFGKVLMFLSKIRPLTENINIYVSTTGSDILGDGTSGNPFKTIQHAIDILPKDLNGYSATIQAADGTYNESIIISGFKTGTLVLRTIRNDTISPLTKVTDIKCQHNSAYIVINGLDITTTLGYGITCVHCANIMVHSVRCVGVAKTYRGIYIEESGICRVVNCEISNKEFAVYITNANGYVMTSSGTGNTYGILSASAGIVHILSSLIGATTPISQSYGGIIVYENGTQIRDVTSAGLSCTWGTISGGYIRHGNIVGTAMVTIQCAVNLSISLSAGITYIIAGFPPCPGISVAVSVHDQADFYFCQLNPDGNLVFQTNKTITAGNYFLFNCTYLTLT